VERTGEAEIVEAIREEAKHVPAAGARPEAEAFKPAVNAGTRKNWKAELINKQLMMAHIVIGTRGALVRSRIRSFSICSMPIRRR
jgi:hypothetical protein